MFRQTKRRTAGRRNFEHVASYETSSKSLYPSRVSFYERPPLEEITLEEFESWAIDRLKILIEIESCMARAKTFAETETIVKPLLLKFLPLAATTSDKLDASVLAERKKDYYSHYTLRLVFCRTEELRKKFVKNEQTLFRIRYNMLQPREQHEFVTVNSEKLQWEYISAQEKQEKLDFLYAASGPTIRNALMADHSGDLAFSVSPDQLRNHIAIKENFIKLPFEKVPVLVSTRQVYVSKGSAYIPMSLQISLLCVVFSEVLSAALIKTFQAVPRLEEDDRLLPLLNNLSRNFADVQYESFGEGGAGDINAETVSLPQITKHFPLCGVTSSAEHEKQLSLEIRRKAAVGVVLEGNWLERGRSIEVLVL